MLYRNAVSCAVYLVISFVSIACLSRPYTAPYTRPEPESPPPPATELAGGGGDEPRFDIWRDNPEDFYALVGGEPRPGDPLTLIFLPSSGAEPERYTALKAVLRGTNGKRLGGASFFDWTLDDEGHKLKACVFAAPSTYDGGEALVTVEGAWGVLAEFGLKLKERTFTSEEIPLNPRNTALRTVPDPKKTAESEHLWAIITRTGDTVYTAGPFTPPVPADTRRTGRFGDRRVYRYSNGGSDVSVHAGIDYGVPAGTPVRACGAGRVALARGRIVTGNSIVIEHLPGLYSIYYHLDQIIVEEGALVNEGDTIGLSGVTGLATGPHLHWELRTAAENTDPDALCDRVILDSSAAKKLVNERGEQIYAELSW
ncbi:MAG: M23 family metallopeptidase [Spirochaetaceae bacterium]|jgi:murein DD-endopeptidase MepM/ murein hydrolase activator NlpD|nr:M23 family metallopeptidase [Spirochaetaceae bacterium]